MLPARFSWIVPVCSGILCLLLFSVDAVHVVRALEQAAPGPTPVRVVADSAPINALILAATSTPDPPPRLAIELAEPAACGSMVTGDSSTWPANVDWYNACRPEWPETGPEAIYELAIADTSRVTVQLWHATAAGDLDIFLMAGPYGSDCLQGEDAVLTVPDLAKGEYFLVVDGYLNSMGAFELQLECSLVPDEAYYLPLFVH